MSDCAFHYNKVCSPPPKGHEQDLHVGMHGRHAFVAGRCHPPRCLCWGLAWCPSQCGERRRFGNVVWLWMEVATVVVYVQWMPRQGSTPKLNICS